MDERLTCKQLLLRLLASGKEMDLGLQISCVLLKKGFTSTGRPCKRKEFTVELEINSRFSSAAAEPSSGHVLGVASCEYFPQFFSLWISLILKPSSEYN